MLGRSVSDADLAFPELEWIHLRTTNLIERLHKEFKRRTKPGAREAVDPCRGGNTLSGVYESVGA